MQSLCKLAKERDSRSNREILVHFAASFLGTDFFQLNGELQDSDERNVYKTVIEKVQVLEEKGERLFKAVRESSIDIAKRNNVANFRDKVSHSLHCVSVASLGRLMPTYCCVQSGQTALIKAIIHERHDFVEWLLVERPELKYVADNVS